MVSLVGRRAGPNGMEWPEPGVWSRVVPWDQVSVGAPKDTVWETTHLWVVVQNGTLGETIWEVETRGATVERWGVRRSQQVRLVRQLPWDARVARLYAADVAEMLCDLWGQSAYQDDSLLTDAIAAVRGGANLGEVRHRTRILHSDAFDRLLLVEGYMLIALKDLVGNDPFRAARACVETVRHLSACGYMRTVRAEDLADLLADRLTSSTTRLDDAGWLVFPSTRKLHAPRLIHHPSVHPFAVRYDTEYVIDPVRAWCGARYGDDVALFLPEAGPPDGYTPCRRCWPDGVIVEERR